ncbi:MAG: GNAT family N-acetyltransferase [Dehalococcoidia bacterium]|nr:GNAT family N-acetyltransferase [Dehalococcoidia bacterium]
MIRGNIIELIPVTPRDKQNIYNWCFHSETTKSHSGLPDYPEAPIASPEEFFAKKGGYEDYYFTGERPQDGRGYLITNGGEPVGFVSYASFHLNQGVAELDIWMNSEANCGKGFGTDALVALSEYLRQTLGKHTLIMRPSTKNERAVRSYNKAGFTVSDEPIAAFMQPEYLPLFGNGDYGPGGDALLVMK